MSNVLLKFKSFLKSSTYWELRGFCCIRFYSAEAFESGVRVRFAPSPTGHLHLGGFRTALINYLFAKKHNGKFLLRIEDTDQTRAIEGTADMIENDLEWLNIVPDESPRRGGQFGPYTQSERLHYYQSHAQQLINSGHAYHCFCTENRLELMKKNAIRQRTKPMYDNKCRSLTTTQVTTKIAAGESYCIRFKLPPPPYQFDDYIGGQVVLSEPEGDFVILKSDKFPTYHLACVVDDHLMNITHVLRGVEWEVSTGKHLCLYKALGINPPVFAHLPLLRNREGSKLSKRQGDISIDYYRKLNYYPAALVNFVLGNRDKIDSTHSIIQHFDLKLLSNHDQKLDFAFLDHLNQLCLKEFISSDERKEENLAILKSVFPNESEEYYQRLLNWCPERVAKLQDVAQLYPFLSTKFWTLESAEHLSVINEESHILKITIDSIESISQSNIPNLGTQPSIELKTIARNNNFDMKSFMSVLRRALCGVEEGPPVREIIHLLGWNETLERLKQRYFMLNDKLYKRDTNS